MKFLLDMGISNRVTGWLINNGHEALHLSDVFLHELPDVLILKKAYSENSILLTADMDFGNLLVSNSTYTISVIQFRVTNFKAENIIEKLSLVFDRLYTHDMDIKFLITVQDSRIRFRTLPI